MNKIIQRGLVLLAFAVPLVFSHATTEVYGLIKWILLELGVFILLMLWLIQLMLHRGSPLRGQSPQQIGPSAHISLGLSAALIALLFQALFNPLLYVPTSAMGFWMLLGLIALEKKSF